MGTSNKRETIVMVERLTDVLPERITRTTRRYPPTASVIGVRPQEVTHRPFMRNLLHTINAPNMVESVDGWREAPVKAEDLIVDCGPSERGVLYRRTGHSLGSRSGR